MSSHGVLRAGPVTVRRFTGHPGDELLAVFRDDMRTVRHVPAVQYFGRDGLPFEFRDDPGHGEDDIEVTEFRAPGRAVAARLELLGIYEDSVRRTLAGQLGQPLAPDWEKSTAEMRGSPRFMRPRTRRRRDENDAYDLAEVKRGDELRESMGVDGWARMLASSPEETHFRFDPGIGGRSWLMDELARWDPRDALRAVLLAFPEADVTFASADTRRGRWQAEPLPLPSDVMAAVSAGTAVSAPVVVLTEGRTDAEFLRAGLTVLYPYLTDLIRFLDYERRPEGGVGALTGMIRAFAAAGIANRVVAVFDNDTAAADAIRKLGKLPALIQVIRYPDLDLAKTYPALEPATPGSSEGAPSAADVNGLAASIELYMGRDVLTRPDGTLRPIRWTSKIPARNQRQGQITDKEAIHRAFRAKAKAAHDNPQHAQHQDWTGLRLIIDAIRAAARYTATSGKARSG